MMYSVIKARKWTTQIHAYTHHTSHIIQQIYSRDCEVKNKMLAIFLPLCWNVFFHLNFKENCALWLTIIKCMCDTVRIEASKIDDCFFLLQIFSIKIATTVADKLKVSRLLTVTYFRWQRTMYGHVYLLFTCLFTNLFVCWFVSI